MAVYRFRRKPNARLSFLGCVGAGLLITNVVWAGGDRYHPYHSPSAFHDATDELSPGQGWWAMDPRPQALWLDRWRELRSLGWWREHAGGMVHDAVTQGVTLLRPQGLEINVGYSHRFAWPARSEYARGIMNPSRLGRGALQPFQREPVWFMSFGTRW